MKVKDYDNILVDFNDGIIIIIINCLLKLNVLNFEIIKEFYKVFKCVEKDKYIKVIIIIGSGEKVFVVGVDISEFVDFLVL